MAKELAIGEYIDFVGYISDLEDKLRIYRNSRIFVSCSKGEGFPVSLLEKRCLADVCRVERVIL